VLFVATGGLLVCWRWGWVRLHLPVAVWGAAISLFNFGCPLTDLEKWAWQQAGAEAYAGSFIAHYLVPLIYPPGLTRGVQIAVGIGVVALNVVLYAWGWRRRARR
jgi:hypothetical protein